MLQHLQKKGESMPPDQLGFASRRFSTSALAEPQRARFWREVFGREIVRLDIEPRSKGPFEAQAIVQALPGLLRASFVSAPAHLERSSNMLADSNDAVVLLVSERGTLAAAQRGREVALRSRDATLLLHAEPSSVTHTQIRFQGLIVPRAELAALVNNVEDAALRPIPGSNDTLRLLMSYVKVIAASASIVPANVRRLVATHVQDLVALIIGATRDGSVLAEERGAAAARLTAVKTDIIQHIGREDLTLHDVATRQGITSRSIQRLFEREGSTFASFKLEQQLALARRMLRDRRYDASTIGAIALAAGFGDLSYFHRAFRRRFGATPLDVRAASG
jgi:AraC-like DNA-binding protein